MMLLVEAYFAIKRGGCYPRCLGGDAMSDGVVRVVFATELPPEIEIPPPPEAISRPAMPVMALMEIDDDITIAPTTFEDNPIEDLPPPPTNDGKVDLSAAPVFTPMTVRPEILNRSEVAAAPTRLYPFILRDAGIGGSVTVWFFLSEEGTVLDRRVSESSGHVPLDEAALQVADVFRFSPALNREQIVQVWIQLPITFQVQDETVSGPGS